MYTAIDLIFNNPRGEKWKHREAGFFTIPKGSQVYRTRRNQFQAARCRKMSERLEAPVEYVLFEGQGIYLTRAQLAK